MSELDADGIPVAVSLRVLKLSRQPYYRWRKRQVTEAELVEAYRANALLDAHLEDPEFGYRFLVGEAAEAGEVMCERTALKICRDGRHRALDRRRQALPLRDHRRILRPDRRLLDQRPDEGTPRGKRRDSAA